MQMVTSASEHPVYSVVAPVYNEAKSLPEFYQRVSSALNRLGDPWELVLVNDGSRDESLDVMRRLQASDPHVKIIDFARNFGHQVAVSAGMDFATGDPGIILEPDLQDPPQTICNLIWKKRGGAVGVFHQRAQ